MGVARANELPVIRFGTFEVDPRTSELRRNGSPVRLQEQPLQILLALVERPGEVVTREELQKRLWPSDTFVDFDHSLNAAVRRLRDALNDSAENPRFVETVARRGYRFIAPLTGTAGSLEPPKTVPLTIKGRLRRFWRGAAVTLGLIAAISVGWHAGMRSRQVTAPPTVRRLTANPEEDRVTAAALSVNGKHLAFSDRNGLHMREIDSGETHVISLPSGFDARPAGWFPDGLHLLATWVAGPREPSSLWEISVVGGPPRKLADQARWPAVSPDGTQVVFVSGPESKWLGGHANQSIWLMQADGSRPGKLLEDAQAMTGPPVWSPDGRRVAFAQNLFNASKYHAAWVNGKSQVKILDLENEGTEVVLSDEDIDAPLAWLPDWRLVYSKFEAPPNQQDSNLWSLRIDPRTGRASGSAERLTSETGRVGALSAARNGIRLAVVRESIQPDVFVSDLEPGGAKLTTPQRLTLDDRQDFPYAWMPDNKSVLFASDRDGTLHIFKQALDQPEPDLLVGGDEPSSGARLSPDSGYILYLMSPKLGHVPWHARLMRMPVAGGPAQVVLEGDGIMNQECARAPETLCLFSVVDEHSERFFSFDPLKGKGSEIPELKIDGGEYSYNWGLSPDGRTLVTSTRERAPTSSDSDVLTVQFISLNDFTRKTFPVPNWAGITGLDWAADSKSVWASAYTTNDTWGLLNVDAQGQVRPVLQENKMIVGWAIPSADGRHLALWEASGNANVWILEKF